MRCFNCNKKDADLVPFELCSACKDMYHMGESCIFGIGKFFSQDYRLVRRSAIGFFGSLKGSCCVRLYFCMPEVSLEMGGFSSADKIDWPGIRQQIKSYYGHCLRNQGMFLLVEMTKQKFTSELIKNKKCAIGKDGITVRPAEDDSLFIGPPYSGQKIVVLTRDEMDELAQKWTRYRSRQFDTEGSDITW